MQHLLHQRLSQHQLQGQALCVAFSGGMDSSLLLSLAKDYCQTHATPLSAIHVHHGLSEHADAWADFCQQTCDALGVSLQVVHVKPAEQPGPSLENKARALRYQAFIQQLQPDQVLLMAHHQRDQAETLLLRLLRASGSRGLSAMPATRPLGQGQLLRPLLDQPYAQLKKEAQARQLQWIEDDSNLSTQADRNFLRLTLLPQLEARFPKTAQRLAKAAELAAQSERLNQDLAQLDLAQQPQPQARWLNIPSLMQLPDYRRINLLRHWLQMRQIAPPPASAWAAIDKLCQARADAQPQVEWKTDDQNIQARRHRQRLYIETADYFAPLPHHWQQPWDNQQPITLGSKIYPLRLQAKHQPTPTHFTLRARQGGERLSLPNRGQRDVKRLLQELDLPPWERNQLPFIWHENTLIAVGDQLIAEGWEKR